VRALPGEAGKSWCVNFWRWLPWLKDKRAVEPVHLRHGRLGELAAKRHLKSLGYKFLTANFRSKRGEIDLVFRDQDFLVFVEVKTRSSEKWGRPAEAVDFRKRQRLFKAAYDYLKGLADKDVAYRFDIVEVLLREGRVDKLRHWENALQRNTDYQ
jgi:putative endonuclease